MTTSDSSDSERSRRAPRFDSQHSHLPAELGWIPAESGMGASPPARFGETGAPSGGDDEAADERADPVSGSDLPLEGGEAPATEGPRKRRRGSRGGRRRNKGKVRGALAPAEGESPDEPQSEAALEAPTLFADAPGAPTAALEPLVGADEPLSAPPADGERRKKRRRRRGRGRNRESEGSETVGIDLIPGEDPELDLEEAGLAAPVELETAQAEESATSETPEGKKKRRRRGSRGGRRRRDAQPREGADREAGRGAGRGAGRDAGLGVDLIPGEEDDLADLPPLPGARTAASEQAPEEQAGPGRRDKRRRRRGRGRDAGVEGEAGPETETETEAELEEVEAAPVPRKQRILVNASDPEEQRVAVVEDGEIVDFQMTVRTENSVVNDIYRGRVVNLEPAIGAAFVDFGQGRNGFLHTSDVLSVYGDPNWSLDNLLSTRIDPDEWDENSSQPRVGDELGEGKDAAKPGGKSDRRDGRRFRARPRLPITDLLKKGQMVAVQVTKDAIGDKGPTLTTYISIPGRYLVLMPSMSRTGVSRKIEDEKERRRLKKILGQLELPEGMGVIVRTAGVGRTKADLKRDLDYLKGVFETFAKRLRTGHGPAPLYQESDIAIRTVRDLATPATEAIIVDDVEVHRQIVDFAHKLMPEDEGRVQLHTGPKPLFHNYSIEPDFERIFSRRIELPSGGSVVFDQAEALVAIDINSGRTRTDGFDFEQIALKTNLEAAPEIARQIRLRDLGGIIVVDFIDMMKSSHMRQVERLFREHLAKDRARFKIGRISQFGLLELTRQRLGPGMNKKVFHTCPACRGLGRVRTVESRAAAILRRLGSALTLKGFATVEVKAHPEVIGYLKHSCMEYLRALEYRTERQIRLIEVRDQAEDSVLRYLRADGKEVRPGGRRKR
jgi:ribonuclease E